MSGPSNAKAGTSASAHASDSALEARIHGDTRYNLLDDLGIAGNPSSAQEPKLGSSPPDLALTAPPISSEEEGESCNILRTLGLQAGNLQPMQEWPIQAEGTALATLRPCGPQAQTLASCRGRI